jgi:tetratricopeptide (TPR) repeat protein
VFFSVADDDEFPQSVQAIEWLYAITANPGKKFVHYAKGGHGVEMFPVHPELPATIVDWYVTTLIKTPGRAPIAKDAPPIPQEIRNLELIEQPGGVAKLARMLDDARKSDPKATVFPEVPVNLMGYDALQSGDIKGAIEIFKLNVAGYPNSPNVYDSLSDAYIAAGQKDLARENVKRALELLPSDTTDSEEFRNGLKATDEQKLKDLAEPPK